MRRNRILDEYYEWLLDLVKIKEHPDYYILLHHLHSREFFWVMSQDGNRATDGLALRQRFANEEGIDEFVWRKALVGPCSVLEMMVALACRCEHDIMGDPIVDDDPSRWFWIMIDNLGLSDQTDDDFAKGYTDNVIQNFLMRKYSRNGKGGLFCIERTRKDIRKIEIWYQMCMYLDTL